MLPLLTGTAAALAPGRTQCSGVPAHMDSSSYRLRRADALPAVDRHRRGCARRQGGRAGGQLVTYQDVRRARPARDGGDERRAARHHVQLLHQVQVLAHLRRDARHAAAAPRDVATGEVVWALLRGAIYATAFLVTMLVFGLVTSWWAVLVRSGRGAHRVRVRRRGAGCHHVHAVMGRLRLRERSRSSRCSCSRPRSSRSRGTPPVCRRSSASRRSTRAWCSSGRSCSATFTGPCC